MYKRIAIFLYVIMVLFLSGCIPILVGAGIGAACHASGAHNKHRELEAKEEYGKYRLDMQQKNLEPLSFEDWLKEQLKDPKRTKEWNGVLKDLEKNNKN